MTTRFHNACAGRAVFDAGGVDADIGTAAFEQQFVFGLDGDTPVGAGDEHVAVGDDVDVVALRLDLDFALGGKQLHTEFLRKQRDCFTSCRRKSLHDADVGIAAGSRNEMLLRRQLQMGTGSQRNTGWCAGQDACSFEREERVVEQRTLLFTVGREGLRRVC